MGEGTYMLAHVLGVHEMSEEERSECPGWERAHVCSLTSWGICERSEEGEQVHRTGAGTYVLTLVLGVCERSKEEGE